MRPKQAEGESYNDYIVRLGHWQNAEREAFPHAPHERARYEGDGDTGCIGGCRGCRLEMYRERYTRLLELANGIERGCDCEYDHRCGRCQRVLDLQEFLRKNELV